MRVNQKDHHHDDLYMLKFASCAQLDKRRALYLPSSTTAYADFDTASINMDASACAIISKADAYIFS